MKTKLLLMVALVATSSLFLDTGETQAQGWRSYNRNSNNRGVNARTYGYTTNRGSVYSNRSNNYRTYRPSYNNSVYRNYSQFGSPRAYGYGNNFNNNRGFGYPSVYGNNFGRNNFGYGSNFNNFGYMPGGGIRVGSFNSGFGNSFRTFGF